MKSSFFATKSVSELTSTIAPVVPAAPMLIATTPSAAIRDAAFVALLPSLTRRISSAFAMSPPASASAFLHSIIGASVLSRSSFTIEAVISAIDCSCCSVDLYPSIALRKKGACAPSLQCDASTRGVTPGLR